MSVELNTESGMHIEGDPKTGAIAASQVNEDIQKVIDKKDDQPEQTPKAEAEQLSEPVDIRKTVMDKIYANRGEQFKRELDYAAAISNGATVEPIIDEKPDNDVVEVVETEVAPEKIKKETAAEVPKKRLITIGTQLFELTDAEIEQLAQRTLYAENQARQSQPQPQQQVQQPPQQQQLQQPINEQLKEIARRISYGSEDESAKALGDFANLTAAMARQNNGPTPEQIADVATARAAAQIRFENNLGAISSEYKDVFESRSKSIVAADKVGTLRQKYAMLNIQKTDLELYREACSDTRQEFTTQSSTTEIVNKNKQAAQPVTAVVNSTRIERKRAAPQPASAVNKVQALHESNPNPTGSDVVQAMRKARGQSAA